MQDAYMLTMFLLTTFLCFMWKSHNFLNIAIKGSLFLVTVWNLALMWPTVLAYVH